MRRFFLFVAAMAAATIVYAAAGQGLKWSASTTYDDGTPIPAGLKVVYVVFSSADGKQVASTPDLSLAASKIPADGCYYLQAGILSATNGVVPGSYGPPTAPACPKTAAPPPPPPPVQKKVATPAGFTVQ